MFVLIMLTGFKIQIINSVCILKLNCKFKLQLSPCCSISVNVLNVEHRLVYRLSKKWLFYISLI